MSGRVASLLRELPAAGASEGFAVRPLEDNSRYFAGRDASGCAALLVRSTGQGRVPLRLAGIDARFAVPCRIAEPGLPETTETLTVILCLSRDPSIEAYFAGILDSLVSLLGPEPATQDINDAVDQLVDLFQRLQQPAQRSLTGLIGELCVILLASDAPAAVTAWRVDPDERFDFVAGNLRFDVKSSSSRRRSHEVSFEQANPPSGLMGLFASIWIEPAAGGYSLAELLENIEEKLAGRTSASAKLRTVVADTLGNTLPAAMSWRFDLPLATSSLLLFEASQVPALRPPLPSGVSAARFVSNFADSPPADITQLRMKLDADASGMLPA